METSHFEPGSGWEETPALRAISSLVSSKQLRTPSRFDQVAAGVISTPTWFLITRKKARSRKARYFRFFSTAMSALSASLRMRAGGRPRRTGHLASGCAASERDARIRMRLSLPASDGEAKTTLTSSSQNHARAGISRTTLYNHFANREALLDALALASVMEVSLGTPTLSP